MTVVMDWRPADAEAGVTGDDLLQVAEVFGPTYQGEGPTRGQVAMFVRLGGCNLHCQWADTGCDAAFTWDATNYNLRDTIRPVPVEDVIAFIRAADASLLVVTGGEPLLHQHRPALLRLLEAVSRMGMRVEFETNGTQLPDPDLPGSPRFNVSPKLGNNHADPLDARIVPAALTVFASLAAQGRAVFKFVVSAPADLDEVAELVRKYQIPRWAVWIMPEGVDPDEIAARARMLADPVLVRRWNLTLRDHRVLWPAEDKGR